MQSRFTYERVNKIPYGLHEAYATCKELINQELDMNVIEAVEHLVNQLEFNHNRPWLAPEPTQPGTSLLE